MCFKYLGSELDRIRPTSIETISPSIPLPSMATDSSIMVFATRTSRHAAEQQIRRVQIKITVKIMEKNRP